MIVAAGGRPANHSDISATPTPDKPAAVFDAIFTNPKAHGLLIGYNYLQMARCDLVIKALLMSMDRNAVDPRRFPIVIRLFGPAEEEARQLAATRPGITYLPSGTGFAEGCRTIVQAVDRIAKKGEAA
jgi:succinyl-CoA synthetase beta subunit